MGMTYDAVVVGGGPNGLAAAITIAQAGRSVVVLEANETVGGAARTAELTLPGFRHDVGSAIHPLALASPFFRTHDLTQHGLTWINPPAAVGHPLDGDRAAMAWLDFDRTAAELGADAKNYRSYYDGWVKNFTALTDLTLRPLVRVPSKPIFAARFGAASALAAATTARRSFDTEEARALFAGHAAHSILPLTTAFTSSFGILLGAAAHAVGFAFPQGGAQAITDSMVSMLTALGGEIRVDSPVRSFDDIPTTRSIIFALTARQVEKIAGSAFTDTYRQDLREFEYGPAAWKLDLALSEPIPWSNAQLRNSATIHIGGSLEEIVVAEASVAEGRTADRPFVLLAQHSLFDPSRAPDGRHTCWAYSHVPNGCDIDQTDTILRQIERFAPGFRDTIIGTSVSAPAALERQNMNLIGGDIGGGSYAGSQLFFRPRRQANPFETPSPHIFIGSASTTPGAGVHGMGGHGAAERALATVLR